MWLLLFRRLSYSATRPTGASAYSSDKKRDDAILVLKQHAVLLTKRSVLRVLARLGKRSFELADDLSEFIYSMPDMAIEFPVGCEVKWLSPDSECGNRTFWYHARKACRFPTSLAVVKNFVLRSKYRSGS